MYQQTPTTPADYLDFLSRPFIVIYHLKTLHPSSARIATCYTLQDARELAELLNATPDVRHVTISQQVN